MRDGFVSMGHGRALINIEDLQTQLDIYEKILEKSLSVRDTEKLVRELNGVPTKKPAPKSKPLPQEFKKRVKEFSEYFGAKVDIKVEPKGKGKLIIPFASEEDFNRIKKLIQGED